MILDKILDYKRIEVRERMAVTPVEKLRARVGDAPTPLDFSRGLVRNAAGRPAVIAEVKKASPSKGVIREDFDPVAIARAYEAGGAAAISVLTDERFFQGSLDYLTAVKEAISLPVLRKDFIIDEYQVLEARAAGADAILLIVAALDRDKLVELMEAARGLGMQCLVEAHDESEMEIAVEIGASLIGINNRNLYTFEVDLNTTARLAPMAACFDKLSMPGADPGSFDRLRMPGGKLSMPGGTKIVSESGIFTRDDMTRLGAMGVDAVLVGEALMRSDDIEAKIRELTG